MNLIVVFFSSDLQCDFTAISPLHCFTMVLKLILVCDGGVRELLCGPNIICSMYMGLCLMFARSRGSP